MGWRKPVPAFIPTPPSSRPTSETSFTLASVFSGGNAGKGPAVAVEGPENSQPPMPNNWLHVVRSASQDLYGGGGPIHLTPGSGIPERQLFYAEFFRSASSMDDHRPPSSRPHYAAHRGATPRAFRPPTPPLRSARRPRSCAIPSMLERHTSLGGTYRMIYPDPPSLLMTAAPHQTLRHSPSLCMSETTRKPTSIKAKPSLQSLALSDEQTAVSSHADIGSWYLPDGDLGLVLGRDGEKMVPGGHESKGKPELPMHYIQPSKLRKTRRTQKQPSCTDMLWNAVVSAGRAIASLFKTDPVESSST